jgi:uncharacterized protein (TIGR02001 family)
MKHVLATPLLAAAVLALPVGANAQGWGYLYGAVKLTTDYRFHGFSESNRRPTWQANLHLVAPEGWYVGAFSSGVAFLDGSTSYEIDWYGGRHLYFGKNDLNLEVLYFTFPDHAGPGRGYNAAQGSAELVHDFGDGLKLGGKLTLSPGSSQGPGYELAGAASYAATSWLTFSGVVAHAEKEKNFHRNNWDVGATLAWGDVLLDTRYTGTDTPKARCYYTDWCATGFTATVTYQFGWVL